MSARAAAVVLVLPVPLPRAKGCCLPPAAGFLHVASASYSCSIHMKMCRQEVAFMHLLLPCVAGC
jgi:hypothetical protein